MFENQANYHWKIRGESLHQANYRSKNNANRNNRCHENAGKFRRNIVSSKISSLTKILIWAIYGLKVGNYLEQNMGLL